MLILEYAYRTKDCGAWRECGACDKEDFMKFWRKMRRQIDSAYVATEEAKYVYHSTYDGYKWQKIRPREQQEEQGTLF